MLRIAGEASVAVRYHEQPAQRTPAASLKAEPGASYGLCPSYRILTSSEELSSV